MNNICVLLLLLLFSYYQYKPLHRGGYPARAQVADKYIKKFNDISLGTASGI
jgi:hypothetical protein